MPLIVVVNLDEQELLERSRRDATLAGLPDDTVMLNPRATDVAKWLARNRDEQLVLVAHHPPDAGRTCEGDKRLPALEAAWSNNVGTELEMLCRKPEDRETYKDALRRFNAGTIEFIVKCLRHRLPESGEPRADASHLFAALVELGAANRTNDAAVLDTAREALVDEFRKDRHARQEADRSRRQDILGLWHRTVADLCVLELDLSALYELQKEDPKRAVAYLAELLQDASYGGFGELAQRASNGLDELKKKYAERHTEIQLDAIRAALAELVRQRKKQEPDIDDVRTIAGLSNQYTKSVRDLSDLFRQAVAESGGRSTVSSQR